MGWRDWNPFASSNVTVVATQVQRLIDDKALPDAVNSGLTKAIFRDGNLPDYVMEELIASIGVRAESMYAYAERSYKYGLPSGEVYSSSQGENEVEAVIEAAEGQSVYIEYSHYGSYNVLHHAWKKLVDSYGYNAATNEIASLSAQVGKTVYLKDIVIVIPTTQLQSIKADSFEQWGTAANSGYTPDRPVTAISYLAEPTPLTASDTASDVSVLVSYAWQVLDALNVPSTLEGSMTLSVTGLDSTSNFFHAKYTAGGVTKFWSYENQTGEHPTLDNVFVEKPFESGVYFPFVHFRIDNAPLTATSDATGYNTSKKLLKYLNMDFDAIATGINENPNISHIEQAMLQMGVPALSQDPLECRYLFDYFQNMYEAQDGSLSETVSQINWLFATNGLSSGAPAKNFTSIQDAKFKMGFANSGIFKRLVAGLVGAPGTYTSSHETSYETQTVYDAEGGVRTLDLPVHTFRYSSQITQGLYEEITVKNLSMTYYIYGGYTSLAEGASPNLLVPIDRSITSNYTIVDRERLYARSFHFIFNSRNTQEVSWYQTGWFQAFVIVVAIAMTIADYGADGGSWVSGALSLTGTEGLIATIIVNMAIGQIVMPKVFALFVKLVGVQATEALVVLALVAGAYQIVEAGGVSGAPWAKNLLMLSTGLESAVIKAKFGELLEDRSEFETYVEEQTKLLDKAKELLENSTRLDPFVIWGEKAEDFYNRTVHFGNIGLLGINAISSYVDLALTLPKLKDTLGEELNATT